MTPTVKTLIVISVALFMGLGFISGMVENVNQNQLVSVQAGEVEPRFISTPQEIKSNVNDSVPPVVVGQYLIGDYEDYVRSGNRIVIYMKDDVYNEALMITYYGMKQIEVTDTKVHVNGLITGLRVKGRTTFLEVKAVN